MAVRKTSPLLRSYRRIRHADDLGPRFRMSGGESRVSGGRKGLRGDRVRVTADPGSGDSIQLVAFQ